MDTVGYKPLLKSVIYYKEVSISNS